MPRKSSALRLAPPTSAPSTLATRHQFLGVRRLHRAAVEDAHRLPGRAVALDDPLADEFMGLRHVGGGRRQAGADGPDRLIGDHQIGGGHAVRQRAVELAAEHVERLAGLALGAGLADADDRDEAGAPGGLRLGAHLGVGFLVQGAALGMADDHGAWRRASASISAEMSPVKAPDGSAWQSWPPIAILEPARPSAKVMTSVAGGQIIRSTLAQRSAGALHDLAELGGRGLEPVHLPIARDQRAALRCGHSLPLNRAVSRAPEAAPEPVWRGPRELRCAWTGLYIPAQSALNRPLIQTKRTVSCFEVFTKPPPIGSAAPSWAWCSA